MADTKSRAGSAGGARAWQRMLSGRRLDLLAPDPADIAIEDIAHGLSRVARWNGQTVGAHAFTVAQHSLIVTDVAAALNPEWGAPWQRASLLHDAPEYVVGDLISPFKAAVGYDYKAFENRLLAAIHTRFDLPYPLPDAVQREIKRADRIAAYYEATRLAGFDDEEAGRFFGSPEALPAPLANMLSRLEALPAAIVEPRFRQRFRAVSR